MQTTMYKQYNPFISQDYECYKTGKLLSGYRAEDILHMITGSEKMEIHNALCDCRDEYLIIKQLGVPISDFIKNSKKN